MSEKDKREEELKKKKRKKEEEDEEIKDDSDLDEDEEDDDDDDEFDDLDEDFENNEEEDDVETYKKKNQNLMAFAILAAGLFFGSLFVDIAQLVRGEGISASKLNEIEDNGVFQTSKDKTWILKNEPIVKAILLTDEECEECQNDRIILNFKKSTVPTAMFETVDYQTDEGKELVDQMGITVVPAVVFEEEITETQFYEENQQFLTEMEGKYLIDNSLISAAFRIPGKKYTKSPTFSSHSEILGNENAEVPVIIYGDFQCPYSKRFAETFAEVYEQNQNKLKVAFKQLPLTSIHPQAYPSAHASLCADDQQKFWEMYTKLYDTVDVWGAKDATEEVFSSLAVEIGLDKVKFDQCMTDDIHREEIESDKANANELSISGTPAAFIGDDFIGGAVGAEEIQSKIDSN